MAFEDQFEVYYKPDLDVKREKMNVDDFMATILGFDPTWEKKHEKTILAIAQIPKFMECLKQYARSASDVANNRMATFKELVNLIRQHLPSDGTGGDQVSKCVSSASGMEGTQVSLWSFVVVRVKSSVLPSPPAIPKPVIKRSPRGRDRGAKNTTGTNRSTRNEGNARPPLTDAHNERRLVTPAEGNVPITLYVLIQH